MAEDEIEDLNPSLGDEHNPFENKQVDEKIIPVGGLYQNWLLSALDTSAVSVPDKDHNFVTRTHSLTWIKKIDADLTSITNLIRPNLIVNCYVKNQNIVWYLYNFLEKTDGVNISINNLVQDLFTKAQGTVAFNGLLTHLIKEYNLTPEHNYEYKLNAIIENFYLLLINQSSIFKQQIQFKYNGLVNIEIRNFENCQRKRRSNRAVGHLSY